MAMTKTLDDEIKGAAPKSLEEDIQALRRDVATLASSIGDIISGTSEAVRNGAEDGLNGATRAGKKIVSDAARLKNDSLHAAGDAASDVTSLLAGEIKRNPFIAVAAALCVGFVAGMARHR